MCGRYTLSKKEHFEQMLREAGFVFDEFSDIRLIPRFNIAPSQQIPVILDEAPRTITSAKWGLIPSWAKDEKMGGSLTNARAETVMEKPALPHIVSKGGAAGSRPMDSTNGRRLPLESNHIASR
jgi:putative SOS response-associated peptidase YedK